MKIANTVEINNLCLDPSKYSAIKALAAELSLDKYTTIRILIEVGLRHKEEVKDRVGEMRL